EVWMGREGRGRDWGGVRLCGRPRGTGRRCSLAPRSGERVLREARRVRGDLAPLSKRPSPGSPVFASPKRASHPLPAKAGRGSHGRPSGSRDLVRILITGAAGMIGRKLTERLGKEGALAGKPIDKLTLLDVVSPTKPEGF